MRFESKHFDEYIMIAPGSDYGRAMWSDLEKIDNCSFMEYVISTKNPIINLAHHVHFSFGVNKRIQLPFQNIWKNSYVTSQYDFSDDKKYCLILTDVSACRIDCHYLKELSQRNNITMVLVAVNTISKKKKITDKRLSYFDYCFSFDRYDCDRYGFVYHPTNYSVQEVNRNTNIESDAFFVGSYKPSRYRDLVELYTQIVKSGGVADFYIINVPKSEKKIAGIKYNSPLSYKEVLQKSMRTNCIVEIMGDNQSGLTLRAMEAICMNKKLYTNNMTIKELNYYSSGYIRYANDFSSIDVRFIKEKIPVDYKYDGDFSPIKLLEHIERLML